MKRPTVTDQIKDARAPSGSVLEKMIRENQDFELLASDELNDDYPVPLWLRVLYRKQHPEITFPAKNPGAAYPEVLSQVYRRMVANPNHAWAGNEPGETTAGPNHTK
jgi:hypothetical protein